MKPRLPKFVQDAHNWHRWWSMRIGALSGACFAAAGVYASLSGLAAQLVAGVPQTILTGLVLAAMALGAAGYLARPLAQRLPPKPPVPPGNDCHQRDTP